MWHLKHALLQSLVTYGSADRISHNMRLRSIFSDLKWRLRHAAWKAGSSSSSNMTFVLPTFVSGNTFLDITLHIVYHTRNHSTVYRTYGTLVYKLDQERTPGAAAPKSEVTQFFMRRTLTHLKEYCNARNIDANGDKDAIVKRIVANRDVRAFYRAIPETESSSKLDSVNGLIRFANHEVIKLQERFEDPDEDEA